MALAGLATVGASLGSLSHAWATRSLASVLVSCRKNLSLVKELGDRAAQGRAYGNLGNTQYLLGNFSKAVIFHKQVGATDVSGEVWKLLCVRDSPPTTTTTCHQLLVTFPHDAAFLKANIYPSS